MKITVWGARGSTPVSGVQYQKYGGDTTCVELETRAGEVLILDAGTGLRPLGNKLLAEGRREFHFLFSHAHWDHLMGFPFFKPLYRPDVTIFCHGCTFSQQSIRCFLKETLRPPFFPVKLDDVAATLHFDEDCPADTTVAGLCCQSIPLSHPNQGFGYRLTEGGRSLGFFPDNELSMVHFEGRPVEDYVRFLKDVDVLIHDGEYWPEEYDGFARGWGHSVFFDTVQLAVAARAKQLVLWHLNQERTDDEVDKIGGLAQNAADEGGTGLVCRMARTGMVLEI